MHMDNITKVAVFCGSSFGNDDNFKLISHSFGTLLAENSLTLVYGGGYRGLMGSVAQGVKDNNGHVIGVLPEIFDNDKVKLKSVEDELIIKKDMHERKKQIYDLADAFIILPGGIGTFDEFFEIFTWKQIGYHNKNIAIYNINGFFNTLISFLKECVDKGFLSNKVFDSLIISEDAYQIIKDIKEKKVILPSKI